MGRQELKNKKRVVIKVGSSSLTHAESGKLDLIKLEILVRELSDLRNKGTDVVLVTSAAITAGRSALGMKEKPKNIQLKQACAAVGQARLMMIYQKLFSEYNQIAGQILMTKNTVLHEESRENVCNTFNELLNLGVIPIVNENDSVATSEIDAVAVFGDNDTLSAVVASLIDADLLILLSDVEGLYTDDPHRNSDAKFIKTVESLDDKLLSMGKATTGTNAGTGGMATKLAAADIAVNSGIDMLIASGKDFHIIHKILLGEDYGTLFLGNHNAEFDIQEYLSR